MVEEKGTKHDSEKNRLDLVPPELIESVGHVLSYGVKKYTDHNWRGGIRYSRVFGALLRHLMSYASGNKFDKETGMSHLWHAACNLAFLITFDAHPEFYKDFDDLYSYKKTGEQ